MKKPLSLLVLGDRGRTFQWVESVNACQSFLPNVQIHSIAFNHNNHIEHLHKSILRGLGLKEELERVAIRRVSKAIQETKPDIILIINLFYFSDEFLTVLQAAKPRAKIFHWIGDFFLPKLNQSAQVVDHFLFTDSTFLEDAASIGLPESFYLPLAVDQTKFCASPHPQEHKLNKLLFVGSPSNNRLELIQHLTSPISLYGKEWQPMPHLPQVTLHRKNIPHKEVVRLYQTHQFALNMPNRKNTREGLTMRCFEASACGAVVLSEYSKDIEKCFTPDENIVTFDTIQSFTEQLEQLYSNPKRTARIAKNAYEHVLRKHTYTYRLQQIIQIASETSA